MAGDLLRKEKDTGSHARHQVNTRTKKAKKGRLGEEGESFEMIGCEYILTKLTTGTMVFRSTVYVYRNYLVVSSIETALGAHADQCMLGTHVEHISEVLFIILLFTSLVKSNQLLHNLVKRS